MDGFRPIPQFEDYLISPDGKIYSSYSGNILTPVLNSKGYYKVTLRRDKKKYTRAVHRLLAETFLENPENKPRVMFKDHNHQNYALDNLCWATQKEIVADGFSSGRRSLEVLKQNGQSKRKLDQEQALAARERYNQGVSGTKLAQEYGIALRTMQDILNGVTYKTA